MRVERWTPLALAATLAGCSTVARLTRPEGDGGWSAERRRHELAQRATAAGVAFEPAAAPPPAGGSLDLRTALALAATRNRRIAEAERRLAASGERVAQTRSRLLATTTGSGRYTRYTDPLTNQINLLPGAPAFIPRTITIREEEFATLNGAVTVPLDLSGELFHALGAAQAGYRGEQARQWATTLEQHVAVIRAYFDLLEAERLREVAQLTLASDRQQLANAESRFNAGRLTKNELLVVQVAVRTVEQELVRRDLDVDRSRWALNQAVGLDVDAPTEVRDVREQPSVPAAPDALREAYAHNPALMALLEEQQRLEETARSLARGRLPRFSGGGAVDYTTATIFEPQTVGSGFVGFTWDLGTDGRREAEIAEARIAADANRIGLERELRELEAAVRETQRAALERLAALAAAEIAVGQAEENRRIRQQQFDAGRATSEDVLDAERLLAAQRATLATALYQAHTRRAELQQLMGLPLDELVAEQR